MKMTEAEVSLRLALWLLRERLVSGPVEVALDGAQIKVLDTIHFDLVAFMAQSGWSRSPTEQSWQCIWTDSSGGGKIRIHSTPGLGDVTAVLTSGHRLRIESKKGPLLRSRSSQEYPLIREAIGQLMTISEVGEGDILGVAVPHSAKFHELATRWRSAPLIARFGILILTVDQSGNVYGFR